MLDYLDFQIEIGPGSAEGYPLTVRSPAGEVRRVLQLPFSGETLAFRLQGLENALLRSSIRHRRLLTPGDQTVQSFGSTVLPTYSIRLFYNVVLCWALMAPQMEEYNPVP